jgi:O-succinylbenzoate synthase
LRTSHGIWRVREGIIITLKDAEGKVAEGEIAPIPWFGSETIAEARQFCQQQEDTIDSETIKQISDRLPACQFGFESALLNIQQKLKPVDEDLFDYCALLPTGKQVLEEIIPRQAKSTFKWKIGIEEVATEIAIAKKLITKLPPNSQLRLDANGGLNLEQARRWLEFAQNQSIIEFIEQPLPPSQFDAMMELGRHYSTPLALDESVTNISDLQNCYQRGWRDVFVIKCAIAGFPSRLLSFTQQHDLDLVFSSVFETSVGRQTALQLASKLGSDRFLGFGVKHWFEDGY